MATSTASAAMVKSLFLFWFVLGVICSAANAASNEIEMGMLLCMYLIFLEFHKKWIIRFALRSTAQIYLTTVKKSIEY